MEALEVFGFWERVLTLPLFYPTSAAPLTFELPICSSNEFATPLHNYGVKTTATRRTKYAFILPSPRTHTIAMLMLSQSISPNSPSPNSAT